MDNDNIYANVTAAEVKAEGENTQSMNSQQVNNSAYQQQAGQSTYNQQVKNDTYQQQAGQSTYGQQANNGIYQQAPQNRRAETKCPGKEIVGLILGIHSLVMGIFGLFFGWVPVYGIIYAIIYSMFAVGCAVAAKILYKKVMEQATTYTNKIVRGNGLATAGLITGIISVVVSIILCCIYVAVGIGVAYGAYGPNSDTLTEIMRQLR